MKNSNSWTDWMGIVASVACAIHCAAMPFVIAFLPMLGLSFLADEGFHKVMVVVCSVIAAAAFVPGLRRHGRFLPVGVATVGLSLIAVAAFALEVECCASCQETQVSSVAAVAHEEATGCGDACCEFCAAEANTESNSEANSETSEVVFVTSDSQANAKSFSIIPWITPLGGLLLVTAHLVNHRFSCRCGCCPSSK